MTTSRSCDHLSGAHVYIILASTTHGVDIYERVFNSLFGVRLAGSSEESIFLVRTPNYLVLFPGYAEYHALLGRNNFSHFWIFLIALEFCSTFSRNSRNWHVFEASKPRDLLVRNYGPLPEWSQRQ